MVTLKSVKGKYLVTVNGERVEFHTLFEALEHIYSVHSRRARASV